MPCIDKLRLAVDKELGRWLPPVKREPSVIHRAMRYSVFSGGKRIRPVVTIEACRASGGKMRHAITIAAAVECIHTYSLIHDDLPSMDDDDYRRGKPSCHKAFGEANAILSGDALLTLAFNMIANGPDARVNKEAIAELTNAIGTSGMAGGQALDMEYQGLKKTLRIMDRINYLKTARLFEASAALGAIAAGAGAKAKNAMSRYGAALGMAFQIVDDCLDGDGYVKIIGIDAARDSGKAYTGKAKTALRIFGNKAKTLICIADDMLERIE